MRRPPRRRQKLPSEPVELHINRLSHDGRAIANIDGKIAFVAGALAGERVMARFTSRRSSYDELRLEEVLEAAPERCEPVCTWAAVCGGCSMPFMHVDAQIEFKQQSLFDQLVHAARIDDFEKLPPIRAASYSYRRKARLAVRYVHKKESTLVGFREKESSFIADMQDCAVLDSGVSRLVSPLRVMLNTLDGKRVVPQIEVAVGEVAPEPLVDYATPDSAPVTRQVALIVRHLEPLSAPDVERLLDFAREHSVELYLQPKGPDTVHKVWPKDDNTRLYYYLPDYNLKMAFHPTDFTQVNAAINRKMIAAALDMLDLQPQDRVLDLFCGLGNFTLPMARFCEQVTGVEGSNEMVLRGAENAVLNNMDNVDFHAMDLTSELTEQPWAQQKYTKILLDPPRSGALEVVQAIAKFSPEKIVYISCNPATLARDAAVLVAQGYRLTRAGAMDMFPHTSHVESMAEFVREPTKRPR